MPRLRTLLWGAALAIFVYVQWSPTLPAPAAGSDKLGHAVLYAFVGALTWLVLPGERAPRSAATLAAGYLAGILMEAGQPGFGRRYELGDLQADILGLVAAAVAMPVLSLGRAALRRRKVAGTEASSPGSDAAGAEPETRGRGNAQAGGGADSGVSGSADAGSGRESDGGPGGGDGGSDGGGAGGGDGGGGGD